jgi:dephospho-CoA kinase
MIRIGVLGDIGSGKTYVAKKFGYPVFDADYEVGKLYRKDKKVFNKLKKMLPKYFYSFPTNKKEVSNAILGNKKNLDKIIKIVHLEIRKKINMFLKKHKNKKIVVLDIPLLLENKINKTDDVLVFVQSKKSDILRKLKKRDNFNQKIFNKFKDIQLPLEHKKKKSQFIIKNNFTSRSVRVIIKKILREIV